MKINFTNLSFGLLCGVLLAGCASKPYYTASGDYRQRRSTGEYFDDKMLATKLKTTLYRDDLVKGTDVRVETHRRLVQLSGFVDSELQRERAEELARGTQGVAAVQNNILIKGQVPIADRGGQQLTPTSDRPDVPTRLRTTQAPDQEKEENLTALQLIKRGNAFVGEPSKDKIIQIRSEKSLAELHPSTWYIVYYDKSAALNATEVKFAHNRMVDVDRPLRILEAVSDRERPMDLERLQIDSDRAIHLALNEDQLKNIEVVSTEMRLEPFEGIPTWKLQFWAKHPATARHQDIGEIFLSAEDGTIFRRNLKLNDMDELRNASTQKQSIQTLEAEEAQETSETE